MECRRIKMKLAILLCIYVFLRPTESLHKKSFKAAVYEHVKNEDLLHGVDRNLDVYEKVTADAAQSGTDIIVFPEIGILPFDNVTRTQYRKYTETIPDPTKTSSNPCEEQSPDHPILTRLSCLAKNNRIYLVANMADEQTCQKNETCRDDGVHIYNTNVAFDRNGSLVSRYHKRFLFFEEVHDRPPEPNYAYFDTEFGRFGMIICFDILFNESVALVENFDVDTLIVSTWWGNELPVLSALEVFSSWSVSNGVNLLVANIHQPEQNNIGSGIFSPDNDVFNYTYNPHHQPTLVTATFNANNGNLSQNNSFPVTYPGNQVLPLTYGVSDFANYTSVQLRNANDTITVCNNDLCCDLKYKAAMIPDNYYFAVHKGEYTTANYYTWYEEVCTVFKCEKQEQSICKQIPFETEMTFEYFSMKGNFSTHYVYPSFTGTDLKLISHQDWTFSRRGGNETEVTYECSSPLLVANLFGRVYDEDPSYHQ